jgi:Zn-dependent metalloprotease
VNGKIRAENRKCCCTFVPPFVLENMARAGATDIVFSIQEAMLSREKRATRVNKMDEFASLTSVGKAAREVYDCQGKWLKRVALVREEGGPVVQDEAVNNAYDYAGTVRDFFKKELNRSSIDNADMNIILNVHYGVKYQNAFWDGDEMTFGDGDGITFINFTKSLDVVAHELSHGVTQWEAALAYQGQSGALNEHFSDVFGSVITQWAEGQTAQTADWLIGDEIMGPSLYGEALRSMKEPGTAFSNALMGKDPQPAHMKDYYTGSGDNYGVHINSGIPNKAFCLSAMDIGTDKAALVWYTALQKLWATANFNDAVSVIVESARLLTKNGQVPKGSTQKIRAAFKAVGLPT